MNAFLTPAFLTPPVRRALLAALAAALLVGTVWGWSSLESGLSGLVGIPLYRRALRETLKLAALCTLLCLLGGYPVAWALRLGSDRLRRTLVLGVVAPAAIGLLLRALGWLVVLGEFGLVNLVLRTLRLESDISGRAYLLSELAVLGSMVQVFFPFMVLALYRTLAGIDLGIIQSARSLGAGRLRCAIEIVLPLSLPGAAGAVAVVFALATGAYVTVAVYGGRRVHALAGLAFEESTSLITWQLGAAAVVVALVAGYATVRWLSGAGRARAAP